MKFKNKYLFPPCLTLFWFLIGAAVVLISDIVVYLCYDYLCEILPTIFTRPGSLSDPEGYARVQRVLTATTVFLAVLPVTYFAMRLDNKRFEHLIVLTEGLYPIRERLVWHLKSFWLSDLIASTLIPVALTLPIYLINEKYVDYFTDVLWCGGRLSEYFGMWEGLILIVGLSLLARLILLPSVLRAWRVSWMTGSIE